MIEKIVTFEALFDALPGNFLVLQPNSPQFTILAISDELLRITAKERENVVGKGLFDVYPENQADTTTTGSAMLKASLQNTIQTRQTDQLPHLRYDLPNAAGAFEERYWSVSNKPVLNAEGEVVCLIHTSREVTHEVLAEKKIGQSEGALHSIFESAPFPIAIYTGREMRIRFANQVMIEAYGKGKDIIGKRYAEVVPEMDPEIFRRIDAVFLTGMPYQARNEYMELVIDGKPRPFYYTYTFTPLRDAQGRVYGILNTATDVTDLNLAHKRIAESVRELGNLANAMSQIVWIAEPNGEVIYYNDRISQFAGARQLPDGSWHWQSILIPEDEQPTVAAWNKAVAEGSEYEKEHRLQMKDGSYRWHLSRAYPQKDESGAVVKWYGTATDVHTQKENEEALRRSEEQLRIALDSAEFGTFTFYPQADKLVWSAKTKEFMGLPPAAEVQPETFFQVMHPEDWERSQALVQKALLPQFGGSYENEFRVRGITDGRLRWIRSKGKVSFDAQGSPIRFTGVTQDITQRKQAEKALEEKNMQLVRINNDLDNFIYTASHDLKAPISNIEGLMQALLRNLPAELLASEGLQRISSLMQQSVERFKRTIDNLTDVVKLQKEHSGEAIAVDMLQVIREVLLDLEQVIREAGMQIEVSVAEGTTIHFSEKNLRSVVYNLLSNSIKYRAADREPRVQIRCESIPGQLVLCVQDNGLGMEQARIGQLFTMFKRFHTHVEGAGIGLYMIKKMVENAGGRIGVESQLGVGTTFRVYFQH